MRAAILLLCGAGLAALMLFGWADVDRRRRIALEEAEQPGPRRRVMKHPPEGPGIVEGTVGDADGHPVAGARVRARTTDGHQLRAIARTDELGRFTLRGVPLKDLWVIAHTDDGLSSTMEVCPRNLAAREVSFVLKPAGTLNVRPRLPVSGRLGRWWDGPNPGWLRAPRGHIRVTVRKGNARYHLDVVVPGTLEFSVPADATTLRGTINVPGATAKVTSKRATVTSTAGPDGSFALAGALPGAAKLTVTAPGYTSFTRKLTIGKDQDIAVRLLPGLRISGRVVDWDRKPIAGAHVRIPRNEHFVVTDARGMFAISGLTDGATLEASASGYRTGRIDARQGRTAMFVLEPGWTLRGVVEGGAGALVGAWDPEWKGLLDLGPVASAIADAKGAFELSGLPHGRAWVVQAAARGRRSERAGPFSRPPAKPLRLALRPAGVLRGVVTLHLVHPERETRSGPDGRFSFRGLEPGRYAVYARPADMVLIDVPAGESAEVVVLSKQTYAISGALVRPDGTPAPGIDLTARGSDWGWNRHGGEVGDTGASAITDGQGRFRIAGLYGGGRHYTFEVEYNALEGKWRAPADDIRVVLKRKPPEPARPVRGTVVDSEGHPVALAELTIRGRYRQRIEVRDGAFSCTVAPDVDEISIVVRRPRAADGSRLPLSALHIDAPVPPSGEALTLTLPPGRLWSGRVVDERGRGVAGAFVEIAYRERQDDGDTRVRDRTFEFDYSDDTVVTVSDGSFAFPGLLLEPFWVRVRTSAAYVYAEPLRIDRPEAVPQIVVRDATILAGRVMDSAGHGVADVLVLTSTEPWNGADEWSGAPFTCTDGRGHFRLGSLVPGSDVTLYLRPTGGVATPFLRRSVVVRAGNEPVTVRLDRGYWLEGELVGDRGGPILKGLVAAHRLGHDEELATAFLEITTRFRLGPLPEGAYELRLRSGERWDLPVLLAKPYGFQLPSAFVRIPVARPWSLRGTFVTAEKGFTLRWMADVPNPSGRGYRGWLEQASPSAVFKSDGTFHFDDLREPSGWAYAFSDQSDRYALAGVRHGEGPIELVVKDGFSLRGRFVGAPRSVQLHVVQGPLHRSLPVAEDGTFHIRGLPPGTWRIEGTFLPIQPVTVEAGATDIVVEPRR